MRMGFSCPGRPDSVSLSFRRLPIISSSDHANSRNNNSIIFLSSAGYERWGWDRDNASFRWWRICQYQENSHELVRYSIMQDQGLILLPSIMLGMVFWWKPRRRTLTAKRLWVDMVQIWLAFLCFLFKLTWHKPPISMLQMLKQVVFPKIMVSISYTCCNWNSNLHINPLLNCEPVSIKQAQHCEPYIVVFYRTLVNFQNMGWLPRVYFQFLDN